MGFRKEKPVFDERAGAETIAHIRENGRVTVLFNAFDGPPRIVRLYGKGQSSPSYAAASYLLPPTGTIHEIGSEEYEFLLPSSIRQPGSRAVIIIDVFKVGTVRIPNSLPCFFLGSHLQVFRRADGQSHSTPSNLIAPSSSTGQPRKSARIASVVIRARRV